MEDAEPPGRLKAPRTRAVKLRPNMRAPPTTAATIDVNGKNVSGPRYASIMRITSL
jgi:hypothetical protein